LINNKLSDVFHCTGNGLGGGNGHGVSPLW
jgi:hypothetical protein